MKKFLKDVKNDLYLKFIKSLFQKYFCLIFIIFYGIIAFVLGTLSLI